MSKAATKVILTDDHQIFIEGLRTILEKSADPTYEIVGESNTGTGLLKILEHTDADLILLDLNLPDMDGLEILAALHDKKRSVKVLALSMFDEPKIIKAAFRSGADGYFLKSSPIHELHKAIAVVLEGETYLSFGLSFTNASGAHSRFTTDGKLVVSYDDKFIKKYDLTKRELEVFKLIGHALSNKEIAKELYISDQTASVHRKNIMRKLGVSSTASLIKIAYEHNLL
jgi:DNA-binding NarL/FixJ family response regulator